MVHLNNYFTHNTRLDSDARALALQARLVLSSGHVSNSMARC
jgi:hypothetical protein